MVRSSGRNISSSRVYSIVLSCCSVARIKSAPTIPPVLSDFVFLPDSISLCIFISKTIATTTIIIMPEDVKKASLSSLKLPLAAPAGADVRKSSWAEECHREVQNAVELQTLKKMNGVRVSTWRLCAEKRRKYLGSMLGVGELQFPSMPEELCGRISELLPLIDIEYAAKKWAETFAADLNRADCGVYGNLEYIYAAGNLKYIYGDMGFLYDFGACMACAKKGKWWRSEEFAAAMGRHGFETKLVWKDERAEDEYMRRKRFGVDSDNFTVLKLRYFKKSTRIGEGEEPAKGYGFRYGIVSDSDSSEPASEDESSSEEEA